MSVVVSVKATWCRREKTQWKITSFAVGWFETVHSVRTAKCSDLPAMIAGNEKVLGRQKPCANIKKIVDVAGIALKFDLMSHMTKDIDDLCQRESAVLAKPC